MSEGPRNGKRRADELRRAAPPSKKPDTSSRIEWVSCPACKRHFRVEIVEERGWNEQESVACPHCGAGDAYSAFCFTVRAHA